MTIMMQGHDVLEVIQRLEGAGVAVWLDGGWGVDALLGRQTRSHEDVDVVLSREQAPLAEEILLQAGYTIMEDARPTRVVLWASQDRRVDVHPVTFDSQGDGFQRLPDGTNFCSPRAGFVGRGSVRGQMVRCLTSEVQILCHTGYELDENDRHDLRLLHAHIRQAPAPAPSEGRNEDH